MATTVSGATTPGRERVPAAPASRSGVWLTDALLVFMALVWGVNFSVVKYGTHVMAPLAFNSARVTLGTAVLVLILLVRGGLRLPRRDIWALLGLGIIGHGAYQILFIEGIARTRAGDAALVIAAAPAFIAIIGRLRGVERVSSRGVAGIGLSLVGIGLVVFGGSATHASAGADQPLLGDLLVLGAALCWSIYTVLLKPYTDRVDGVVLSTVTLVGGAIPLLLVASPQIARTDWAAVDARGWGAVAYSGVFAMVLAYLCWYRGVRVLGPTRTAMFANLQPLIALVVAWISLGEAPGFPQLAGGAAIMGGLLLTRAPDAPPES